MSSVTAFSILNYLRTSGFGTGDIIKLCLLIFSLIAFIFIYFKPSRAKKLLNTQLDSIALGLNIEGGYPKKILGANKIWGSVINIIDIPTTTKKDFKEIAVERDAKKYMLLESVIPEINEKKIIATHLLIALYFISNGKKLTGKNKFKITIHFHQDKKIIEYIKLFNKYLCELKKGLIQPAGHLTIDSSKLQTTDSKDNLAELKNDEVNSADWHLMCEGSNITLEYRTDDPDYFQILKDTTYNYDDTDILLSFSQSAGTGKKCEAGDLQLADVYIPYDIRTSTIRMNQQYKMENYVKDRIKDILASTSHIHIIEYVNKHYVSDRKDKIGNCAMLKESDFIVTPILQVNELWNPNSDGEKVVIIQE